MPNEYIQSKIWKLKSDKIYDGEPYGQEIPHTSESVPETLERILNLYKNTGWHHDSCGIVHSHA